MPKLLSSKDVSAIRRLRVDGWRASWATSDPKESIVLLRGDDQTPVEAQDVVASWGNTSATPMNAPRDAAQEGAAPIVLRRPKALGFDVEQDDTFLIQGMYARITRVHEASGMIFAEAVVDAGS